MEALRTRVQLNRFLRVFCIVLCAAMLIKWEKIFLGVCRFELYSDLPLHVELALGHNDYGLSSFIIRALYAIGTESFAQTALSVILTVNNLLFIFSLAYMLKFMLPGLDPWLAFFASECALLCGPWLIPGLQTQIYLGAHNGNLYHNITILFSRTLIPVFFVCFCKCLDELHTAIKYRDVISAALTLLIITLFKPSFAFALIPMLAVILLYDFIKQRAKNFKNDFILGCAAVPAGLTCIWQYLVLYDDSFAGTSSSIIILPFMGMGVFAFAVMYFRSLLLPIYILPLRLKKEPERRHIRQVLICYAVALLEACFLNETGYRANHGNFQWGSLAIYPAVFAISIALLLRMMPDSRRENKPDIVKCLLGVGILLGHVLVGVYYMYAVNAGYIYQI